MWIATHALFFPETDCPFNLHKGKKETNICLFYYAKAFQIFSIIIAIKLKLNFSSYTAEKLVTMVIYKKKLHMWRRWGTPQNFFWAFIDELEKQIINKKTVEVDQ